MVSWKRRNNAWRQILMVKTFHTICIAMKQQCYRLILSTNKVKIIILNICWRVYIHRCRKPTMEHVEWWWWWWWWWIFQDVKRKDFCNLSGVTKLIINEQDVTVKTCKIVEYTPSKLCENKGRAWRSHQRHHHRVQGDYYWFGYPRLRGVPG